LLLWSYLAQGLASPINAAALLVGWAVVLGLVAWNHPLLWAMPVPDQLFVQAYERCVRRLADLWSTSQTVEWSQYLSELKECRKCFAGLSAPGPEWAVLRDAVVADLSDRATFVREAKPGPEMKAAMQDRWDSHEAAFIELQHRHVTFWLLWPWVTQRQV
jgi:hypothetical protein